MPPPALDDDLGLYQRIEDLPLQQIVAQVGDEPSTQPFS
jgi:hypothetical protein